jgi:uncharacterized membrane protein (UPF0127 family)
MSRIGRVIHAGNRRVLLSRVRWCSSFMCKLRGLMFRRALHPGEGLILVELRPSRTATAIHMLFVPFAIAVVWLDDNFKVVDTRLARPWRPFYAPAAPARYTLEAAPDLLNQVRPGDTLAFEPGG